MSLHSHNLSVHRKNTIVTDTLKHHIITSNTVNLQSTNILFIILKGTTTFTNSILQELYFGCASKT